MNNLLNQVSPLTRGIIWLTEKEQNFQSPVYKDIDYLLDGLLTANLETVENVKSRVIVGGNFNKSFFVLVASEINPAEVQSYLSLFSNDLISENDILVIDEINKFEALKPHLKAISSNLRVIG